MELTYTPEKTSKTPDQLVADIKAAAETKKPKKTIRELGLLENKAPVRPKDIQPMSAPQAKKEADSRINEEIEAIAAGDLSQIKSEDLARILTIMVNHYLRLATPESGAVNVRLPFVPEKMPHHRALIENAYQNLAEAFKRAGWEVTDINKSRGQLKELRPDAEDPDQPVAYLALKDRERFVRHLQRQETIQRLTQ